MNDDVFVQGPIVLGESKINLNGVEMRYHNWFHERIATNSRLFKLFTFSVLPFDIKVQRYVLRVKKFTQEPEGL